MTYKYLRGDLKDLLQLAVEHRLPAKVDEWKENLDKGRLTDEMRSCFAAFGWISSRQDARVTDAPEAEAEPEPEPPQRVSPLKPQVADNAAKPPPSSGTTT